MGDAFEVFQTGPDSGELVVMGDDGVASHEFVMELAISIPTNKSEWDAMYDLSSWVRETDESRFWALEIALLQFDNCPGSENFVADEVRDLRAFLAEQRGTERWNDGVASLLAKFVEAESQLPSV